MENRTIVTEKKMTPAKGWVPLMGFVLLFIGAILAVVGGAIIGGWGGVLVGLGIFSILASVIGLTGLMAIAPNDSRVLLLFGEYRGTVVESGFFWVNPFYSKKKVSLRVRNFETGSQTTPEEKDATGKILKKKSRTMGRPSKVNDSDGNPIEISAVVVWKVVDTAEALFEVDDYEDFVGVQSEAALRNLATRYPYDSENHEVSLRGSTEKICDQLRSDLQERLSDAGVHVLEARISHLAYAPEIAAAMLQRQQAGAIIAARSRIVDGAVGMVEAALGQLQRDSVVELDESQRASLVSNLLVVLCSDRNTQPVIQTGS